MTTRAQGNGISGSSDSTCICNKDEGTGKTTYWCHCHMGRDLLTKTTREWYPFPSMKQPPFRGANTAIASTSSAQYNHSNFLASMNYYNLELQQEKWIKHYSNRHKILLVDDGDFSFSACLAVAFGSASNITATSLDSEEFLTFDYCEAFILKELKERGCKMISQDGEIHITHKTNGYIVPLGIQQGLELVDSVEFNVSDYPGYSNKYAFGGDNSFDCYPSKTYMFRLPRTTCPDLPWL
nr:25S rRNA (uracil2634-N3)-methyltransferase [Ipomoea batatas]